MKVLIDNREKTRVQQGLNYFSKYEPLVTKLTVGDYIFDNNGILVVFEFKTVEDFINSTITNRVHNQGLRQAEEFDYHFIIIVGNEKEIRKVKDKHYLLTGNHFTNNQWNGQIADLTVFSSVLTARTESLAFDLMERVALKCTNDKPVVPRYPKTRGCPAYRFLLNNVNGIGEVTAERIVEDLGLWFISDVFALNVERLKSVKGVGEKSARNILGQILREYS